MARTLCAEGKYAANFKKAYMDTNKNENPFLVLIFDVYAYQEENGEWEIFEKSLERKIMKYLSEKAFEYTCKDLVKHLGWNQKDFEWEKPDQEVANPVYAITEQVEIYCAHEANTNYPEKWNFQREFRQAKPPSAGQKTQLNSRLADFRRKSATPLNSAQVLQQAPATTQSRRPQAPPPVVEPEPEPEPVYETEEVPWEEPVEEEIPFDGHLAPQAMPPVTAPVTAPPATRRNGPPVAPVKPAAMPTDDMDEYEEGPLDS